MTANVIARTFGAILSENDGASGPDPSERFIREINLVASGLGMTVSRFLNPHGLPVRGQRSTALLKACRRDELGYRDAALLRTAYDIGGRRSELVAIRTAEIDGPDADGAGSLLLPVSKTDRMGEGAYAYLSPATMAAIARWRAAAKIDSGHLFRRVHTHFDGSIDRIGSEALHANSVTLILKRLVSAAAERGYLGELSESQIDRLTASVSSHSIRVGVAQDNFAGGEGLPAIM